MSAVCKGLLVGFVNVVVVGFLLGLEEGVRHLAAVMLIVMILGTGPALVTGAVSGWIAGRLGQFRRLLLVSMSLSLVVGLGVLSDETMIPPAILPTMISALVLEYWTRPNLSAYRPRPLPSPRVLGVIIGVATVVVSAFFLAIYVTRIEPRYSVGGITIHPPFGLHFAVIVVVVGTLPGMVVGAISGLIAERLRDYGLLTRLIGIGSVAVSGVFAIASLTDTALLAVPALMPTLVAVAILERLTRPIEAIPPARLHRAA